MGSATRHRTQSRSAPLPGWVWLATGLAIGLFIAFLVYLGRLPGTSGETQLAPPAEDASAPSKETKTAKASKADQAEKEPPPEALEPTYGFYTELLNMEVEVPVEEPFDSAPVIKPAPKAPTAPTAPTARDEPRSAPAAIPPPKSAYVYVLQLPSFKSYRAADSLKARLALMGIESSIQTVAVGSKEKWFRVRVGPYTTSAEANSIQQRLRRQQVPSVMLKLSK